MSKHTKIVAVSVDAHAKSKLVNAGKAVAELATAAIIMQDDTFGTRPRRR